MESVGEIVRAGWISGIKALWQKTPLAVAVTALTTLTNELSHRIDPIHVRRITDGHGHFHKVSTASSMHLFIHNTVALVLSSIIVAPYILAVHRFVLLKDASNIWAKPHRVAIFTLAYFGLNFLVINVPDWLRHISPLFLIAYIPQVWLLGRLCLVFPAAALDFPNPISESWKRTRGHWWFSFRVLASVVPGIALGLFLTGLCLRAFTPNGNIFVFEFLVVFCIAKIVGFSVAAALASTLFRRFGEIVVLAPP